MAGKGFTCLPNYECWLEVYNGDDELVEKLDLSQKPTITIGAGPKNDIRLNHPSISESHGSIFHSTTGRMFMKPVGNADIFIKQRPFNQKNLCVARRPTYIRDGTEIYFGSSRFKYVLRRTLPRDDDADPVVLFNTELNSLIQYEPKYDDDRSEKNNTGKQEEHNGDVCCGKLDSEEKEAGPEEATVKEADGLPTRKRKRVQFDMNLKIFKRAKNSPPSHICRQMYMNTLPEEVLVDASTAAKKKLLLPTKRRKPPPVSPPSAVSIAARLNLLKKNDRMLYNGMQQEDEPLKTVSPP